MQENHVMNIDCMDLRPWAQAHRYRFRYEESYRTEQAKYRGDGRWYVEVLCKNGLIYPQGGDTLLAYCKSRTKARVAHLSPEIRHYQFDGFNEVLAFPSKLLNQVAEVLKPRKRRILDPSKARAIGKSTQFGGA